MGTRFFKGRIRRDYSSSPYDMDAYEEDPAKLELAFAAQRWRERHGRYPDCREVLQIALSLGYRKCSMPVPPS